MISMALKSLVFACLAVAMFVGIEKHRESGTRDYGSVITIVEGAAWPIPLLMEAMRKP
jgi:hypothetical protein